MMKFALVKFLSNINWLWSSQDEIQYYILRISGRIFGQSITNDMLKLLVSQFAQGFENHVVRVDRIEKLKVEKK